MWSEPVRIVWPHPPPPPPKHRLLLLHAEEHLRSSSLPSAAALAREMEWPHGPMHAIACRARPVQHDHDPFIRCHMDREPPNKERVLQCRCVNVHCWPVNDDGFLGNKVEMAHTHSAVAHSTLCEVFTLSLRMTACLAPADASVQQAPQVAWCYIQNSAALVLHAASSVCSTM